MRASAARESWLEEGKKGCEGAAATPTDRLLLLLLLRRPRACVRACTRSCVWIQEVLSCLDPRTSSAPSRPCLLSEPAAEQSSASSR